MEFNGKVILISGATGGMGKEAALQLSQEKCKLAIFARREEKLKEISEEINTKNAECIYKKCDVKNRQDVKEAVEFTIKNYGRIDIAFLTAGVLIPNPIETFDVSVIKDTIDINFMGTIYLLEQILPIMKSQKSGTLAVVSSLADVRGV